MAAAEICRCGWGTSQGGERLCRLGEAGPSPPVRGGVIRAVRESERPLVEPACQRILERWSVDGESRQPVTWETLVECLEDIKHCTLASDLRRGLEP